MTNAVEKVVAGDVRTVARLIRDIDDRVPEVREIINIGFFRQHFFSIHNSRCLR